MTILSPGPVPTDILYMSSALEVRSADCIIMCWALKPLLFALPYQMLMLLFGEGYGILAQLDEYKARMTSTFGSTLKMDLIKRTSKV